MSQKRERNWKGEERAGTAVGAVAGLGHRSASFRSRAHPLLRCPGIRFTPNCKAAGLAFVLAFSFAGSMRKGKVGSVGLQVNARPMGYLGDDWWARKHRNSLFHLQAGLQGLGGKLENLSADSSIYLEIRRSIAKQSVKVVMLVGEWEWEPDWGQWSTLWGICNLVSFTCVCVCVHTYIHSKVHCLYFNFKFLHSHKKYILCKILGLVSCVRRFST